MLMRALVIVAFALCAGACTQKNPNLCCTTQADCDTVGLALGIGCSDGLLCRGNQCIAETCSSNEQCDPAAPFCNGQACVESCTDDAQCPGFGGDAGATFCVSGGCASCRADHDDCPASAPICDDGACRTCVVDTDCASAVCDLETGACVDASSILYVTTTGGNGACTQADPCSLAHGLSLVGPSHSQMHLDPGTYAANVVFPVGTQVRVVGVGAIIDGGVADALKLTTSSNITLRGLKLKGSGFVCLATAAEPSTLTLVDVDGGFGGSTANCRLNLLRSKVSVVTVQSTGGISADRTQFAGLNLSFSTGIIVDIQNSVFLQAPSLGGSAHPSSGRISFSTFVMQNFANCTGTLTYEDNIFLSTGNAGYAITTDFPCTATFDHNLAFPQTTAIGTSMIMIDPRLASPLNGDFHLSAGSPAIDAADSASIDPIDFDGTSRPQGAARDLGAFEFH